MLKDDVTCIRCTGRMRCDVYTKWLADYKNMIIPRVGDCSGYNEDREYTQYLEEHMKEKERRSKC